LVWTIKFEQELNISLKGQEINLLATDLERLKRNKLPISETGAEILRKIIFGF